ncbi:toll/interleukin-1 receptor-like protein [Apium graveolens]|uniref:toll/interleukin-1 receptor-like protein n=1 Tax=Apium graveolens TaxID=4045 RepID=UPI003D79DB2E
MATTSNHISSSSCTPCWDVFLSFYGKDTRENFTAHLYSALVRAGILTFRDDPELDKGEEISRGLLNAIHGSQLLIVVLSQNYASSRWCLDELVEILTCKRTSGNVVIPVFYYIDPSHLRYLKGGFKDALDVHKTRYSVDVIEKWKSALAEIAELSGYHLKTDATEYVSFPLFVVLLI